MPVQVPVRRGEAHPASKLTNEQRWRCRDAFKSGAVTVSDLARSYQVSRDTVRRIVHQPADWLSPSSRRR